MPETLLLFFQVQFVYLFIVLGGATFLLLRGIFAIRREEKRRVSMAEDMDYHAPVIPAESAGEDEADHILNRQRAVQSIEARFDYMRRFYIPLVLFVTLVLVSIPFLPTLPATYLSLVTGLLAGVVGFAAKPVIENAISGMVLTFSQPIRINDTVIIDGQYGTVEKINLLHTRIKIWNYRRLVIPNNRLLQKEIENLTLGDEMEWAYIEFCVEPDVDIHKVKELAKAAMDSKYLDGSEEPSFWVIDMQKDAILCWVAGWASHPAQAWALRSAARRNLIQSLREHNISFHMANTNLQFDPKSLQVGKDLGGEA
jgi:small-conductance mechanosensitive channel